MSLVLRISFCLLVSNIKFYCLRFKFSFLIWVCYKTLVSSFFYGTDSVLAKKHLTGLYANRCFVQKIHRAKILHCENVTVITWRYSKVSKWKIFIVQKCRLVKVSPSENVTLRAKVSPHTKLALVQKWPVPYKHYLSEKRN